MVRLTRADLETSGPIIAVTLTDGTDQVDERVMQLAQAEANQSGLRLGQHLGILDEPHVQLLCHVFAAERCPEP